MTAPPARSFVLVAVLVIVAAALLVATSLLFLAQADLAGAAGAAETTQRRLLAWSGAQAVMMRLDRQRDRILEGDTPELDDAYVIYEAAGREGVVRLLPVGPGDARVVPEAGRLDLNVADARALAATGLVDETLAGAIVAHRDRALGGGFQSVAEVLGAPGMTPERLYGPLEELTLGAAADDLAARVSDRLGEDEPRGLADVVTVYAIEPALQRSGTRRINLGMPWSEELGRRMDRRFGAGAGAVLKQVIDGGTTFDSDAVICRKMTEFNMEPGSWPPFVDALTTEEGEHHRGRLDINTASVAALTALEGLDAEQAAAIARARGGVGAEERATIAWPAIAGIVEPEAYELLAGRITTRSWTYRVRLEVRERGADAADEPDAPGAASVVYEVVIDLADPTPRIAYFRDVTRLETSARLVAALADGEETEPTPAPERGARDPAPAEDDDPPDVGASAEAPAAAARRPSPAAGPSPSGPQTRPPGRAERVGRWRKGAR